MSPTRPPSSGRRPRRSSARSACRRRSGPSPGPAARRSRATSSTTRSSCAGRRVLDFAVRLRARRDRGRAGRRRRRRGQRHRRLRRRGDRAQRRRERRRGRAGPARTSSGRRGLGRGARRRHLLRARPRGPRRPPGYGLAGRGATVLIGDPGRSYLPRERLEALATYEVPVTPHPGGRGDQAHQCLALPTARHDGPRRSLEIERAAHADRARSSPSARPWRSARPASRRRRKKSHSALRREEAS